MVTALNEDNDNGNNGVAAINEMNNE